MNTPKPKKFVEEWREFHAGLQVSNTGKIRSFFRSGDPVRKETAVRRHPSINRQGNPWIGFGGSSSLVKTLVARYFLGYQGVGKVEVIDGNRQNCHMHNLRIVETVKKKSRRTTKDRLGIAYHTKPYG